LESSDWPRKQQTGGLSQRRLQSRAEERVAAFARRIADEVASTLETAEIQMLVVAGDEVMTSALAAAFPQSVSDRIIATIRLDIRASEQEVIEATLPLVEAVERDQELDAARAVTAELATNQAAAGAPAVLRALQTGQVATLVVVEDFAAEGWADFAREVYGVGPIPKEHPLAGDMTDIVPVALEEALIRLAVRTGADIQIIESGVPVDETGAEPIPPQGNPPPRSEAAQLLDDLGGIGALLRFSLE
jgi:peptide subunit release factor 1 (eRF1)